MQKIKELFLKYYNKYKEIINYLIFGVLTTVVNYISYVVCAKLFRIDLVISTSIAWFLSVLFAYITNKIYVFESKTNTKAEILKEIVSFFWFRILSGVLDIVVMYISVNLMKFNDLIMKLVSNIVVIALNYIFSKMFIFKEKKNIDKNIESKSALDTSDAPVNIFRYIIQLSMMIVTIYITYWNFSIINILFVLLLLIIIEIILECIENYKYSKKEKKDNFLKKIFRFIYDNFHFVILIFAFIIRLFIFFKLKIESSTNLSTVGMLIYEKTVVGLLGNKIWLHIFDSLYGSIVCLLIYLIAKELFSKQSAMIVSLIYTIGIYVSAFCGVLTNQRIFSVFILMGIYILISSKYDNMNYLLKYSIIAVLFAIANIFRKEAIIYIISIIVYVFINSLKKDKIKKGTIIVLLTCAVYFAINICVLLAMQKSGIDKSKLKNSDVSFKVFNIAGNANDKNISNKNMRLKEKIHIFEVNQKQFWNSIPYNLVFNKLENTKVSIFGKEHSFNSVLGYITTYDLTLVLFSAVSMTIFVLYSKIKNLEDKRIYLLYLIILTNFFVYSKIGVDGRYSYLAKVIVYILAAGGIEVVRRNAEKEAKELNSKSK